MRSTVASQRVIFSVAHLAGRAAALAGAVALCSGCYSIRNGWLDPTTLGKHDTTGTMEIRTSLTLEDTPGTIPGATYPLPEDLTLIPEDLPIVGGDQLVIEIHELRDRGIPFQAQVQVSSTGNVNLPVIGRIRAEGLTVAEFEDAIKMALQEKEVLLEPQVTINPILLQNHTYSIFGIGVSASDNAPLRAGTFPIRRPDLRILEAINLVGGLNEFVSEVYIFRNYELPEVRAERAAPQRSLHRRGATRASADEQHDSPARRIVAEEGTFSPVGKGAAPVGRGAQFASMQEPRESPRAEQEKPESSIRELLEAVEKPEAAPTPSATNVPDNDPEHAETQLQEIELEPDDSSPFIFVNGEWVRNPNRVDAAAPVTGAPPSFEAPSPAINWSAVAGDSSYRILLLPAERLRSGDLDSNIFVRPGDVIRIVSGEIGTYYVMGQVNRVGAFAFNAEQITLKAAIAAAGGLSSLAWPDRCTVYRRLGQREQMIQVNLDRIFAGVDPDFIVRRSDIINVGTHPFAPFLARIRAYTLPNPVNNVGYSFTYSRNYADIDSYAVRQNPANEPDRFPNLFP